MSIFYLIECFFAIKMLFLFRWNKFWWGGSPIECPSWEELPYDTRKTCDNFVFKYREKCLAEITHLTRYETFFLIELIYY